MKYVFVGCILLLLSVVSLLVRAQEATSEAAEKPLMRHPEDTVEPTPSGLRDDQLLVDVSLITGDPCAAPCWRGITPGETDWDDALTILENDPTLTDPVLQRDEETGAMVAEFQQINTGAPCCQTFSETGEVVDIIFLRVAPIMSLGKVIEVLGEPTYLVGSPFDDGQAIMNLIFPDIPLVVYAFVGGTTGELTDESEIIGVLYLKESDLDTLMETTNLHMWEGYGTYESYAEGEYEVTPAVTSTPIPSNG